VFTINNGDEDVYSHIEILNRDFSAKYIRIEGVAARNG